jgi:hypothetical protein
MLGGILADAGYFMGDELYGPGVNTNPKGFFESREINAINEEILAQFNDLPTVYRPWWRRLSPASSFNPKQGQRWLAVLPEHHRIEAPADHVVAEIRALTARSPFAFKDPRFSYTLPAWDPYLPNGTVLICIFRDPQTTIRSTLVECADPTREYLADLRMNRQIATAVWRAIYRSALRHYQATPERFFFVHYDQVFDGSALPELSRRLGVDLSPDFVDPSLRRTSASGRVSPQLDALYRRLCGAAGFSS